MQITSLDLQNYRNISSLSAAFNSGCNIIYGENGQGKTNILESIYMCGYGRSHKNSKEKEIIKQGCEESHIKAEFQSSLTSQRVDIHLRKNRSKGIALNRVPLRRMGELYGNILIVMFSSEDLDIVKRSPSDRRKYIDMQLCQLDPIYMDNLVNYNKLLEQRRELFKQAEVGRDVHQFNETLDIWDLSLCKYGTAIIRRRREFIEELNKSVFDIHYELSGGKEKLKVVYEPSSDEEMLYQNILKNRERDRLYKQTHVGPHRDDLSFLDDKTDLRVYGSSGQQRSCALSLKLAEISVIKKKKGENPVLLLDDVMSELDRNRQKQLIKSLSDIQTIITCTGMDEFIEEMMGDIRKIQVKDGQIITENG